MLYLSRGKIVSGKKHKVSFRRNVYVLDEISWLIWVNGYNRFCNNKIEYMEIFRNLEKLGLVATAENNFVGDASTDKYFLLAKNILVYNRKLKIVPLVFGLEKDVLLWIRETGLALSVEEIVCLIENNVPHFTYEESDKLHKLVEVVYKDNKVEDNYLLKKMAQSRVRDAVVDAILNLAKKNYVILS